MPRLAKALTAIEVKRLTTPGMHAVGTVAGLRLCVKPTGSRSWVLRTMIKGRRAELGMGGYPTITLAQAFERARAALDQIRAGADPAAERRAGLALAEWTFARTAAAYIEAHRPSWRNAKHGDQWMATLATYVYPVFGHKQVAAVSKSDVLAAIEPIWTTKHETATRVRNRIELVLAYAMQREYMPECPNPARWRGNLDGALPKTSKVGRVEHFRAVAIDEVHGVMQRIRAAEGMGARALELVVLTASRAGPVRTATWDEVDLDSKVWTCPPAKMKAGREHRVPLSDEAVELLRELPRFEGTDVIFPGSTGKPLSDMSLTAVMRRLGIDAVPHGFRSTFRDWAAERTATPNEVAEMALAHAVSGATEAAYRRGDLFEKRRAVMQLWAGFIDTTPPAGNVRAIRGKLA